eukprot:SM000040S14745  [mRNA]  locus=s40:2849:8018:- [translate_table: standard]
MPGKPAAAGGASPVTVLSPDHAFRSRSSSHASSSSAAMASASASAAAAAGSSAPPPPAAKVLPQVSSDLKDVLSTFKQTFVMSDATNPELPILFASEGFYSLTGYQPAEVIGRNCRFLQGPNTDQKELDRLRECLRKGETFCGRLLNYRKDGSTFWNLLTVSPVKDDAGRVIKYIGCAAPRRLPSPSRLLSKGLACSVPPLLIPDRGAARSLLHSMQVEVTQFTEGTADKATRPNNLPISLIKYDEHSRQAVLMVAALGGAAARQKEKATSNVQELVQTAAQPTHPLLQSMGGGGAAPGGKQGGLAPLLSLPVVGHPELPGGAQAQALNGLSAHAEEQEAALRKRERRTSGFLSLLGYGHQSINQPVFAFPSLPLQATTLCMYKYSASTSALCVVCCRLGAAGAAAEQPDATEQDVPVTDMTRVQDEDDDFIEEDTATARLKRRGIDLATTLERIQKNFVITDPRLPDNPIIFASDDFLELTEYTREEILGRNCRFLQGEDTDRETVRRIREAIDTQTDITCQLLNYTKSGKPFWNLFHLQAVRDSQGDLQYFIGVQLDGSSYVEPQAKRLPEKTAQAGTLQASHASPNTVGSSNYAEVRDTAQNIDGALREFPDAGSNAGELWALHSMTPAVKPHKSQHESWAAIRRVKAKEGKLGLKHFRPIKPLGSGDTGSVHLVELRDTGKLFAMKAMDKDVMINRNKVHRARTEREILGAIDHPFLPTLYGSFQTATHVCLITDFCRGGELYTLLERQPHKRFSEEAARCIFPDVWMEQLDYMLAVIFFASEVLTALEYLHCQGVVYRDLKPENVLLTDDGHVLLTDFDLSLLASANPMVLRRGGGAKKKKSKRPSEEDKPDFIAEPVVTSNSFVGTEEYIAPEIINGGGHSSAVDWWAFGIFLYEMIYGKTPFRGRNRQRTFTNILMKELIFPSTPQVSLGARQLVKALLTRDPAERLGARAGAAEIKAHPFFADLNWPLIRCKASSARLDAPLVEVPVKMIGVEAESRRSSASGTDQEDLDWDDVEAAPTPPTSITVEHF